MSDPKPDRKPSPEPASDPDWPQVRRNQNVSYRGVDGKKRIMVARRFNGVGNAWLTPKDDPSWKSFEDDPDGFWAREGNGPGEWETIPPRKKPKKQ